MIGRRLISLNKTLIILLTLVFASAIFSASISVIYSLDNFNQYLYGNQENVLVIHDTNAQTPFTSRIPASYDLILNQIEGVDFTSPELMIPGTIQKEPLIMRGVDLSAFAKIQKFEITAGRAFKANDSASIMIGTSLADRLDIKLGDIVNFGGAVKNNNQRLLVVGIFDSTSAIDDEVLAPHAVATKLARRAGEFNHIKVKFDPSEISADKILNQVNSRYTMIVDVNNPNNTLSKWKVNVYDFEDDLVYEEISNDTIATKLPFGEYKLELVVNGEILDTKTVFLDETRSFTLNSGLRLYSVELNTLKNNQPTKMKYRISNQSQLITKQGISSSSGVVTAHLPTGKYFFEIFYGRFQASTSFTIEQSVNPSAVTLNINTAGPKYSIKGLENHSIISRSSGLFLFEQFDVNDNPTISIDNSEVNYTTTGLFYNLEDGEHNISISDTSGFSSFIQFNVNNTFQYFESIGFSNFSRFTPNSTIKFNTSGILDQTIQLSANTDLEYSRSKNNLEIQLPNTTGSLEIKLAGTSIGSREITKTFHIILEENPSISGLVGYPGDILVKNTTSKLWYSQSISGITFNGTQTSVGGTSFVSPSVSGRYNLTINHETGESTTRLVEVIGSPFERVVLENETIIEDLASKQSWSSSQIKINQIPLFWELFIASEDYQYRVYENQSIPTLLDNQPIESVSLRIPYLQSSFNISVDFQSTNTNTEVPIIPGGMRHINPSGVLVKSKYNWDNIDYQISNIENDVNSPIVSSLSNRILISPGVWNITATGSFGQLSWEMVVPKWNVSITSVQVKSPIGNITVGNSPIYAPSTIYQTDDNVVYFEQLGSVIISPRVSLGPSYDVKMGRSMYQAQVSITFPNGTQTAHTGIELQLDNLPSGQYMLNYSAKSRTGQVVTGEFSFKIVENYKKVSVTPITSNNKENIGTQAIIKNQPTDFHQASLVNTIQSIRIKDKGSQIQYILSQGNLTKELDVLSNFLEVKIITEHYTSSFLTQSGNLRIDPSFHKIAISTFNQNYNSSQNYTGLLQTKFNGITIQQSIDGQFTTLFGINRYQLSQPFANSSTKIINSFTNEMTIQLPVIRTSATFSIQNDIVIDKDDIIVSHQFLTEQQQVEKIGNNYIIRNFPIGPITIKMSRGFTPIEFDRILNPPAHSLDVSIQLDREVNTEKYVAFGSNVSGDVATRFFNEEISGPFAFLRLSLIVETIIIILLLIVNVSGVFAGLVYESRFEVRTALSLGFSKIQVITSILYDALKLSLPAVILGNLLGLFISNILVSFGQTVIFGHRFLPSYPFTFWFYNIVIIHVVMVAGAWVGFKLEEEDIRGN